MQIISVRDKRVKALVEDDTLTAVRGFTALEVRKIAEMIVAIRVMTDPAQLAAFPAWRAHELKGQRAGTWSLTVTRNYRLTFLVDIEAQTVAVMDYEDYH
ncbi:type II toxin-antitoxin system RelE/ParE family toxin [Rhizorhabdus histidinilytica]|uniref:Proteic killer suppression protein n=1 Tax=Rhizorhabdus histidinilytica TaxID=439228 RepID=A0A1T5BVG5_9SPHN|nr:type II toxin-antitoxin system RelE/ParE family toxin [Rhizorhabdus histidinilytica]SKB51195.1 proteic killer suppression protein [Rhizorhabdus histidinilytica]